MGVPLTLPQEVNRIWCGNLSISGGFFGEQGGRFSAQ